MKKAFSLVELMIIIIAISVILSAFIPMITKKLKMNDQSIGAGGAVSETVVAETVCTLLHGENCIDCTKEACTKCSSGFVLDQNACHSCALYIPNCKECSSTTICTSCLAGYKKEGDTCIPCEAGTYSSIPSSTCLPCEAQYYSQEGATSCTPCPESMYSDTKAPSCTSCSITWPGCTQCTIEGCTNCLEGCTLQNKSCSCPPPTLSKQDTWFTKQSTISKDSVSSIEFVHAYKPTGSEHFSWNASDDDSIQAMAYAVSQDDGGYKIIINDNYSGKIYANQDSGNAFLEFKNAALISFFNGFDASNKRDKLVIVDVCNFL